MEMNDQDRKVLARILTNSSNSNNSIQYIKNKYSPGTILKSSSFPSLIIKFFGLKFYLDGVEQLYKKGEEISIYKNKIMTPEMIKVNEAIEIANKNGTSKGVPIYFKGNDFFRISKEQRELICNNFNVDRIELNISDLKKMMGNKTTSFAPITIICEDISELSIDDLEQLKVDFNIKDIRFKAPNLCAEQRHYYSVDEIIKCRTIIEQQILSKIRVPEIDDKKSQQLIIASQVMYLLAEYIEKDYEALDDGSDFKKHKKASNLLGGLLERRSICGGYAEVLRNTLACCGIESILISGFPQEGGEGHVWNQIKLGDDWYNCDLTLAREDILKGRETAELFCNDDAFYCSTDTFFITDPRTGKNVSKCTSHRKYNIAGCEKHSCNRPTLLGASTLFKPTEEIHMKVPTISMNEYLASKRELIHKIIQEQQEFYNLKNRYSNLDKENPEGWDINE